VFCCGSDCVVLLWKGLFCFAVGQPLVVAVAAAPSLAVDTLHPTASFLLWISWLPWVISGCRCLSWCNLQLRPPYLVCCRCSPSVSLLQVRPFLCVLQVKEEPPLCLMIGALTCLCVSCVPLRSRPCLVNRSKGFLLPSSLSAV
jgi:hypothetical protein